MVGVEDGWICLALDVASNVFEKDADYCYFFWFLFGFRWYVIIAMGPLFNSDYSAGYRRSKLTLSRATKFTPARANFSSVATAKCVREPTLIERFTQALIHLDLPLRDRQK